MPEIKSYSPTETAAELRKALKAAFPGKKISVKTDKYAGGSSIDVNWIDGPAETEVRKIADQFAGATFDGMTDCKDYHTSSHNGETVRWGADFVHCNRHYTPAAMQTVMDKIGVTEMVCVSPTGTAYLDVMHTNVERRRQIRNAARETSF